MEGAMARGFPATLASILGTAVGGEGGGSSAEA